jgi:predicted O-methyltransferase YrrM
MSLFEVFCLAAITRKFAPSVALEIGTYDGRGTMALARNMTGMVYTVNLGPDYMDLYPDHGHWVDISRKVRSGERALTSPESERIVQIFSDSTKLNFNQFGVVDLIVIDGGHGYDVVKSDTENALRVINRERGVIIWHDATDYGVGQYLPQLALPLSIIDGTVLAVLFFDGGQPVDLARLAHAQ